VSKPRISNSLKKERAREPARLSFYVTGSYASNVTYLRDTSYCVRRQECLGRKNRFESCAVCGVGNVSSLKLKRDSPASGFHSEQRRRRRQSRRYFHSCVLSLTNRTNPGSVPFWLSFLHQHLRCSHKVGRFGSVRLQHADKGRTKNVEY
jgi:hypothetical protein